MALVVIPARMASTRLPGKPLAEIAGAPMIVHVWRRAVAAGVGPVVVACAEAEIADAVEAAGGRAVLTRPDHPSGTDRVFEAVEAVEAADAQARHDVVLNVQGDLPTLDPALVRTLLGLFDDPAVEIGTLAVALAGAAERAAPNLVKVSVADPDFETRRRSTAVRFLREPAAHDRTPYYHHIGLYGFRRAALERFVRLPPSAGERSERLEQLRALDAGMRIEVAFVDSVPFGVDTPADLERARAILGRSP